MSLQVHFLNITSYYRCKANAKNQMLFYSKISSFIKFDQHNSQIVLLLAIYLLDWL